MSSSPWLFVKDPNKDFSRKRKMNIETFFKFFISMEGNSLKKELLNHFNFTPNSVTASAFNQQRDKLLPEAFEYLFHEFSHKVNKNKLYYGYRLLACDGSNLNIHKNMKDTKTYFRSVHNGRGFNLLHLNALYDLKNRMYLDAIIQNGREKDEYNACTQMVDRSKISEKVIITADRGYENYNLFAHVEQKSWNYVICVKDNNSNGIVARLKGTTNGTFDMDFSFILGRKPKSVNSYSSEYRYMPSNQKFDYLPLGSEQTYLISFRVVRFLISENCYETIITNLKREEFPITKIKEIYNLR